MGINSRDSRTAQTYPDAHAVSEMHRSQGPKGRSQRVTLRPTEDRFVSDEIVLMTSPVTSRAVSYQAVPPNMAPRWPHAWGGIAPVAVLPAAATGPPDERTRAATVGDAPRLDGDQRTCSVMLERVEGYPTLKSVLGADGGGPAVLGVSC